MSTGNGGAASSVVLSIVGGRLRSIVDDMATTLANTARSSRISVRRQFACALLDGACRAAAVDNPRFVAALQATTQRCVDAFRFDLADDDVLITNDPYGGSPSVHYFTVVAPIRLSRDAKAYVAVQAHMADIGGWVMGNYDPTAHEVRTEGVRFSPMKIIKFGRRRRDVVETLVLNSRLGDTFEGDLSGQLAAVALGRRELDRLATRYGPRLILEGMERAIAYSERRARLALERIPVGRYEGEATFGAGDGRWRVHVVLHRSGEETTLDFSQSDRQAPIFLNCPPSTTMSQALIPLLGLLDEDIPWNAGILAALQIVARQGTLVAPRYPGPTGWSPEHVGCEVAESVRQALAAALPDRVGPGLPSRDLAFTVCRERRRGSVEEQLRVTDLSVLAQPGSGAASEVDGWGQPGPEALGRLPSIEEFERETGLAIRELEYRPDSGGAGAARGGLGTRTVVEFPPGSAEHLYAVVGSASTGDAGTRGGRAGSPSAIALLLEDGAESLTGVVTNLPLAGGTAVRIDSAGGAGFGDPADRSAERIRDDVIGGRVSPAAAREVFGAELDDAAPELPAVAASSEIGAGGGTGA